MLSKHEFRSRRPAAVQSRATPSPQPAPVSAGGRVRRGLASGAVLAGLWQVLHWGDPASWVVGLPAALGGAIAAAALPAHPRSRIRPAGALKFAAFVGTGVLRGAFDVGVRSLRPDTLNPGFIPYRTDLPEGAPRRIFALFITLMPGTLTVRLDGTDLTVHALDRSTDVLAELRELEQRIAALFGVDTAGETT